MASPVPQGNMQPPRNRRLWTWFLVGFLATLVGTALFWPMYFYDGVILLRTVLGHYYILELRRLWNSSGYLGPASSSGAELAVTAAIHLALSAVAGAALMGVGAMMRRRRR
jgi:hypothetical protein